MSVVVTAKNVCATLILLSLCPVVSSTKYSFSLAGPSKPVAGQQLATITVLDNYRLDLDVVFHSQPSYNEWTSIFQVGSYADQRLPALYWRDSGSENRNYLTMHTTTNSGSFERSLYGFSLGSTYHILMELVDGVCRIEVNYAEYYKDSRTLKCAESLPLWFSAPYNDYRAADCSVSNLLYETWDGPSSICSTPKPTTTMPPITTTTQTHTTTTPKPSSTTEKPTTTTPAPTTVKPTTTFNFIPSTTTPKPTTTTKPSTTSSPTEWMPTTSAKPTSQNTTESKASSTSASTALPTTTLDSKDSGSASPNWPLIFGAIGVGGMLVSALALGYFLRTAGRKRERAKDDVVVVLERVSSAPPTDVFEEEVVVLEPVISAPTFTSETQAEYCEEEVVVVADALGGHWQAEGAHVTAERGEEYEEKAAEFVTPGSDPLADVDLDESSSFDY